MCGPWRKRLERSFFLSFLQDENLGKQSMTNLFWFLLSGYEILAHAESALVGLQYLRNKGDRRPDDFQPANNSMRFATFQQQCVTFWGRVAFCVAHFTYLHYHTTWFQFEVSFLSIGSGISEKYSLRVVALGSGIWLERNKEFKGSKLSTAFFGHGQKTWTWFLFY